MVDILQDLDLFQLEAREIVEQHLMETDIILRDLAQQQIEMVDILGHQLVTDSLLDLGHLAMTNTPDQFLVAVKFNH